MLGPVSYTHLLSLQILNILDQRLNNILEFCIFLTITVDFIARMHNRSTVSYTHLDVYKRQAFSRGVFRVLRDAIKNESLLIPGSDTGNQRGISPVATGDQPARLDRAGRCV